MTFSQSPSAAPEQIDNTTELSTEAQARVDATVNAALKILESTPEMKELLQSMFDKLVQQNLRDPDKIKAIQDWLYESHTEHIKELNPEQKKIANESFTEFMEKFSHNLAYMHRDIHWDNELVAIQKQYQAKSTSLKNTYNATLWNLKNQSHPTEIA